MAGYRSWQAVGLVFFCIGLPMLGGGLFDTTSGTSDIVVGLMCLAASAGGFHEAWSRKRTAEARHAEISRFATEAPPEHDPPR
ncbi:hypothetical protein JCM9957A_31360 [Kineosporia succinea]|uniref:Uncharacterized protein n=1 Tax=Kineosporia succinea TaxID=84632 RepID=A0ABT9P0Z4_9ACTN|nr:hypothetical protein [Kineosporia succinea]